MRGVRHLLTPVFAIAFFGIASCATTDVTEAVRSAPVAKANGSYGYVSDAGLVVTKNEDTIIPYDVFVGEKCIKHLKSMSGFMRKIQDSQCKAHGFYNPQTAHACRQYAAEKQRRVQIDQLCLAKQEGYKIQSLYMKAVPAGTGVEFAHQLPTVTQARFNPTTGKAALQFTPSKHTGDAQCFMLTNDIGQPVPVRDASHNERFLFSATAFTEKSRLLAAKDVQNSLEAQVNETRAKLQREEKSLVSNRAFENGSCVQPAKRKIPPKPKGMSYSQIEYQANGGCTDLIMRRFDGGDAVRAYTRLSWDDKLRDWRKWSSNTSAQNSCSKNLIDQFDTSVTEIGCSLFFKKQLLPACIQDLYQTCVSKARSRCAGPVQYWEREVSAIKAEPIEAMRACRSSITNAKAYSSQLSELELQLSAATDVTNRRLSQRSAPQRMDLAAATCTNPY